MAAGNGQPRRAGGRGGRERGRVGLLARAGRARARAHRRGGARRGVGRGRRRGPAVRGRSASTARRRCSARCSRPRPDVVARELFRVVKPGGTVGLANWGPYGSQGELFALQNKYAPPLPEGVPWPREWGLEEVVQERLGPYASSLQMTRRPVRGSSTRSSRRCRPSAPPGRAWRSASRCRQETLQRDGRGGGFESGGAPQQGHRRHARRSSRSTCRSWRASAAGDRPPADRVRRVGVRRLGAPAPAAHGAGRARGRARAGARRAAAADGGRPHRHRACTRAGRWRATTASPARASALNGVLPRDVRVVESERAPDGFDARRDALSRTYRYRLHTAWCSPFERGRALHWPHRLDRAALDRCAAAIVGTHDFTAFTPDPDRPRALRAQRDARRVARGARRRARVLDRGRHASCATWCARSSARCSRWPAAGCRRRSSRGCSRADRGREAGDTAAAHGLYLESVTYP